MDEYIIGVDIGGTTAKLGLFKKDEFPEFEMRSQVVSYTENGGSRIIPDIADGIEAMIKKAGITKEDIYGIGVGVPGPVIRGKEPGNTFVNCCVNLNWGVKDVAGELTELLGIENINIINDANAAALGEVLCGTDLGLENDGSYKDMCAVIITIGTGVGGGIVLNGEVLSGVFGAAGEIGHIKVAPQHEMMKKLVNYGIKPFADLEYYTSAIGISRVATAMLTAYDDKSALRKLTEIDAKAVFDAAKNGDGLAIRTTDFFFDTLGIGLAAIAAVLDPHVFIIGGGVSGAGDYLLDGLRWAYREHVFHASLETKFKLAILGNDAGVIGAASSIL